MRPRLSLALLAWLAACSSASPPDADDMTPPLDDGDLGGTADLLPPPVPLCDVAAQSAHHYYDIGGNELGLGRKSIYDSPANVERLRIKSAGMLYHKYPDQSVNGEFKRVTGVGSLSNSVVYNLNAMAGAPSNWAEPPDHSSVTMYSFALATFQVCYAYAQLGTRPADDPFEYSLHDPTEGSVAVDQCRIMARKFWNRTPTQTEVDTCATLAKTQTADPNATNATNARLRRWALACGALLMSTHFLTY